MERAEDHGYFSRPEIDGSRSGGSGRRSLGRSWITEANFGKKLATQLLQTLLTPFQIYRSYAQVGLLDILSQESMESSVPSLLFSGIPAVVLYHLSDYAGFIAQNWMDFRFDEDEEVFTDNEILLKHAAQSL